MRARPHNTKLPQLLALLALCVAASSQDWKAGRCVGRQRRGEPPPGCCRRRPPSRLPPPLEAALTPRAARPASC